jgi:hypothetical protein
MNIFTPYHRRVCPWYRHGDAYQTSPISTLVELIGMVFYNDQTVRMSFEDFIVIML